MDNPDNTQDTVEPTVDKNALVRAKQRALWAIKELADASSPHATEQQETLRHLQSAEKFVLNAINKLEEPVEWTDEEAHLSGFIHTALRKNCDTYLSCLLYRWVELNLGQNVWHAFLSMFLQQFDAAEFTSNPHRCLKRATSDAVQHAIEVSRAGSSTDQHMGLLVAAWISTWFDWPGQSDLGEAFYVLENWAKGKCSHNQK